MSTEKRPYKGLSISAGSPARCEHKYLLLQLGAYQIYMDSRDNSLEIYTTDYDPGNLILEEEGLEFLLSKIKQFKSEEPLSPFRHKNLNMNIPDQPI